MRAMASRATSFCLLRQNLGILGLDLSRLTPVAEMKASEKVYFFCILVVIGLWSRQQILLFLLKLNLRYLHLKLYREPSFLDTFVFRSSVESLLITLNVFRFLP
jgi:hypothetical protein